uniref:Uncharacterized protein n=1 Tax=Myotis myotis TaxID=51298 RepID=A0A7J7ZY29_MYOMY|nr:hypothetical protein mMyoMyo1_009832 [Myotis myotis]
MWGLTGSLRPQPPPIGLDGEPQGTTPPLPGLGDLRPCPNPAGLDRYLKACPLLRPRPGNLRPCTPPRARGPEAAPPVCQGLKGTSGHVPCPRPRDLKVPGDLRLCPAPSGVDGDWASRVWI